MMGAASSASFTAVSSNRPVETLSGGPCRGIHRRYLAAAVVTVLSAGATWGAWLLWRIGFSGVLEVAALAWWAALLSATVLRQKKVAQFASPLHNLTVMSRETARFP